MMPGSLQQEFAGLPSNLLADLIAEFEGVEELTTQLANGQWQAIQFGQDILKLLDNGLLRA